MRNSAVSDQSVRDKMRHSMVVGPRRNEHKARYTEIPEKLSQRKMQDRVDVSGQMFSSWRWRDARLGERQRIVRNTDETLSVDGEWSQVSEQTGRLHVPAATWDDTAVLTRRASRVAARTAPLLLSTIDANWGQSTARAVHGRSTGCPKCGC